MGSIRDEVRGETKTECYEKWATIKRDIQGKYDFQAVTPSNKEDAMESMKQDQETGEWVLKFHFDN